MTDLGDLASDEVVIITFLTLAFLRFHFAVHWLYATNFYAMHLKNLVPNVFYSDIRVGLKLFVEVLGFTIVHDDLQGKPPFCVVKKDSLKALLMEDADFAAKDRPEFRAETDDIEAAHREVSAKAPEMLHPNLREVTLRPWGAKEFAVLDASGVCVIFQQW